MTRYGGDLRRRQVLAGSLLLPPLALTLSGFTSIEALFAPKAELWPYWQDHNPNDQRRIDHGAWRKLLAGHILTDGQGLNRFNYSAVTAENRRSLNAYINALADLPITDLNRDEQLAYWINLYNALTVKLILQHYPVATIRDIDISPGLFSDGPWDKPLVTIEGHPVSLNDIEHRILRPIWQDPRIHYAVNCASVGCPNLQAEAFTGENLDSLLDAADRGFVNSPRGRALGGRPAHRLFDLYLVWLRLWRERCCRDRTPGAFCRCRSRPGFGRRRGYQRPRLRLDPQRWEEFIETRPQSGPDQQYHGHGNGHHQDLQGQAHAPIVAEAVTAGTHHQGCCSDAQLG